MAMGILPRATGGRFRGGRRERRDAVELPAAVVGNNQAIEAVLYRKEVVFGRVDYKA
jgi:hypothetical protein